MRGDAPNRRLTGPGCSSVEPGSSLVVTANSGVARRVEGASDTYYTADSYDLDSYPSTYAAICGNLVTVDVDDPRSDAAEASLLMLAGLSEMVMCGGEARDGTRWVVEVLADELSVPIRIYGVVLRAGVAVALSPPSAHILGS